LGGPVTKKREEKEPKKKNVMFVYAAVYAGKNFSGGGFGLCRMPA
jgi:hypothetical protein